MDTVSLCKPLASGGFIRIPIVNPSSLQRTHRRRSVKIAIAASANGSLSSDSNANVSYEVEEEDKAMSSEALNQFIELNKGSWKGSFYQYDVFGAQLQCISTELSVTSYGEDDLASLLQTLKIKQAPSKTTISESQIPEWEEFKLRETSMLTVEKHQQIGFFPEKKAFSLRHQTAAILDKVLRVGVLGEDDVGEEFPKNLKVPSRRPSIVSESCFYSMDGNNRYRAFHVLNQQGLVDTIGVFCETREREGAFPCSFNDEKSEDRINSLLGRWSGHSVTKRSGLYGATVAESDTYVMLEMDGGRRLTQDISAPTGGGTNLHWNGTLQGGLVVFDGGFQMTLLPGGIYMACPTDISKCVNDTQSFCLEFSWMESPGTRQRLVRTFDVQGLVVSTTYITEAKI
eukprot:TRINITY_DN2949_c0_g1_i1.p1 TRINITY_DN2949_c0_g1~~TRINITY_DN2949_c0_g1_i1.p1  ORF type:complete len:400 (-),score=76.13 TRINITY_DN2949_c0_g1_i1:34-1233(-)